MVMVWVTEAEIPQNTSHSSSEFIITHGFMSRLKLPKALFIITKCKLDIQL